MKRLIALAVLCLCLGLSAAQISYFNEGFLRQGDAHLDRVYLELIDNPINTNTPAGMTNVILAIAGGGGGGAQVWTNNGTYIYPSALSTNGTFTIRTNDGSTFVGMNAINSGVSLRNNIDTATFFPFVGIQNNDLTPSASTNWEADFGILYTNSSQVWSTIQMLGTKVILPDGPSFSAALNVNSSGPISAPVASLSTQVSQSGTNDVASLTLFANPYQAITIQTADPANGGNFIAIGNRYKVDGTNSFLAGFYVGTNGFKSLKNNGAAPSTIIVGGSPFTFNNTQPVNIQVFIDANGGTDSVTFNGGTIFTSLAGADHTIIMQPGDAIVVTYSVATPVMKYREF